MPRISTSSSPYVITNPKELAVSEDFFKLKKSSSGKKLINKWDAYFILFLCITTVILFYGLGKWGVTETSEARYAEISREMYSTGDYIHPKLLQIGHYHKPPVTYWITSFAYSLFGVNPFAVRFFVQIAVLLQIILVYKIGIHLFKLKKMAFIAAVVYVSCPTVIIASHNLTTDAYLATFTLMSTYGWMKYRSGDSVLWLYLFYMSLGLGFLTKGPVVFIVPLTVVTGYNIITKSSRDQLIHHIMGGILMLGLGISWFVQLYLDNPFFLDYFLLDHTVRRFGTNDFGRSKPLWFYLLIVPVTSFPWFFMLIKSLFKKPSVKLSPKVLFIVWIFIPLIFFSIAKSKLILYILPIYPGIALATAYFWQDLQERACKSWFLVQLIYQLSIITGLLLIPVLMSEIRFSIEMYVILGVALLINLTSLNQPLKFEYKVPLCSVVFILLLTLFSTHFFRHNPQMVNDQRHVAEFIDTIERVEKVFVYDRILPSLSFHLQRDIISIYDGNSRLKRELRFETNEEWRKSLIDLKGKSHNFPKFGHDVLVAKKKDLIPLKLTLMSKKFQKSREIDGWIIYYNTSDQNANKL